MCDDRSWSGGCVALYLTLGVNWMFLIVRKATPKFSTIFFHGTALSISAYVTFGLVIKKNAGIGRASLGKRRLGPQR